MFCSYLGLGVRNISMFQHGDNDDLHFSLMEAFPQLKDGGGYELLKANQSRVLEVIPSPADGYTASYLRDIVGQGKVYIRPIQRDLSLNPVASSVHILLLCATGRDNGSFTLFTIGMITDEPQRSLP